MTRSILFPCRRLTLSVAALLPLGLAASTLAAPPEFFKFDETIEDDFLSDFCGFPVEVHAQGMLIIRNGGAEITGAVLNTWTNLENGKTLTIRLNGLQRVTETLTEDGLLQIDFSFRGGNKLIAPGSAVVVNVGFVQQTLLFDPETNVLVSVEPPVMRGNHGEFTLEMICELLSD